MLILTVSWQYLRNLLYTSIQNSTKMGNEEILKFGQWNFGSL